MQLPGLERLGNIGFVGERKALALLCLAFYTVLFFLITLSARTGLPEWLPAFSAMTLIYVTAFMGVAAEWFWGRWFATGLGYWGCTMSLMAFVTTRSLPLPLVIFGTMHGLVAACLGGAKMASLFDAKPDWRTRWKLDEQGVLRVRRSVTRAASSLPALVMFALAPREAESLWAASSLTLVTLLVVGLLGLVSLLATRRTFGVLALGAAGVSCLWAAAGPQGILFPPLEGMSGFVAQTAYPGLTSGALGLYAGLLLLGATFPFWGPISSFLRRRAV